MGDLSKLIDLSLLQLFGEGTIVPINRTISLLSLGVDALADAMVASESGANGLRYYNGNLQYATISYSVVTPTGTENPAEEGWYIYQDGEYVPTTDTECVSGTTYYAQNITWTTIETGGGSGGSIIHVSTDDDNLFNGNILITDGESSYTGTLSASGEALITGVTFTGTITVTVTQGLYSASDIIAVPYYGFYDVTVATGTVNTINITTTEPTLYGKTITATYGSSTKSTVFSATGTAMLRIVNYTGAVNFTSSDGTDTATGSVTIESGTTEYSLSLAFYTIYGAEWDGTSTTAWTRTDDAAGFTDPVPYYAGMSATPSSPFDSIEPWASMTKESRTGGTMVKIPKFYYKITQNGNGMKVQISTTKLSGYRTSPAHMDRGDGKGERDFVYIGRYHCGSSNYTSTTGQTPKNNITRSEARSGIHALGSNIWQSDFATRFTIWLLYIVEFADWNSQAKIGGGCSATTATSSAVFAMGYTDSMPYHTGTVSNSIGATVYGGEQYRNIEGLWDNCYDWMDGCYYDSNGMNIILNPNSFSDTSGGVNIGTPSSGYPSKFQVKDVSNTFLTFIPTEASGSDSTFSCDGWDFDALYPCLCAGGYYSQGQGRGLFCVYCSAATVKSANLGCRLLELP